MGFSGARFSPKSLLLGNNLGFDFVVSRLRDNLLPNQIILGLIRSPVDDLLRVFFTYARKSIQLLLTGGVQVHQICIGFSGSLIRGLGFGRLGWLAARAGG